MKRKIQLIAFVIAVLAQQTALAQWTMVGTPIEGVSAEDQSGRSISLSGDGSTLAIGSIADDNTGTNSGSVRVYENINGTWTQMGIELNGKADFDIFGVQVGLSYDGKTLAAYAFGNDDAGSDAGQLKVFEYKTGAWTQIGGDINGEKAGDGDWSSTISLSNDGSTVALGSPLNISEGTNRGEVRVFKNVTGAWVKQGSTLVGDSIYDRFGSSISLNNDGSILAVGAIHNNVNGSKCGQVRVYKNIAGTWTPEGNLLYGDAKDILFGTVVSLNDDGSILAVGARGGDLHGTYTGQAQVFQNIAGVWTQQGATLHGDSIGDFYGHKLHLNGDGTMLAVGATENGQFGMRKGLGYVRVYRNFNETWIQEGDDIVGEMENDGGYQVLSLSKDGFTLAIGAATFDGKNGANTGRVRVFEHANTTDIKDVQEGFKIYPNPTNGILNVEMSQVQEGAEIQILDALGKVVLSKSLTNNTLDVSFLNCGVYYLQIKIDNGVSTQRFMKY